MNHKVTIALDAMGGDLGPKAVIPAARAILEKDDSVNLVLVGLPDVLEDARRQVGDNIGTRLSFQVAGEVVTMDEHPAEALRKKKNSSLRVCVELVKSGRADACVSSGNTGALMATARHVLKTLPGIDRPAIISAVPGLEGSTFMLDLGANVGCTPLQLFQFALMGSVVAGDMLNVERPRVGLLNIGEEYIKGNEITREAGDLLSASSLNYLGFIEGDDVFYGKVDVVVTDGFVGNVAIKTMEGVANVFATFLREEFQKNIVRQLEGIAASSALEALRAKLDSRRYNGASLVGLTGVVIKSHGGADKFAFETAVNTAIVEARKGVPVQIGRLVADEAKTCTRA